jgi:hypothetical protein
VLWATRRISKGLSFESFFQSNRRAADLLFYLMVRVERWSHVEEATYDVQVRLLPHPPGLSELRPGSSLRILVHLCKLVWEHGIDPRQAELGQDGLFGEPSSSYELLKGGFGEAMLDRVYERR